MWPLPLWEIKAAGLLAAVLALGFAAHRWNASQRAQGAAQCQAERSVAAASASEAARAEERRRTAAQLRNTSEINRMDEAAATVRAAQDVRTAAASRSMLDTIAALRRRASDPTSTAECPAVASGFGELLGACAERHRELASEADAAIADARKRNAECVADYDALSK